MVMHVSYGAAPGLKQQGAPINMNVCKCSRLISMCYHMLCLQGTAHCSLWTESLAHIVLAIQCGVLPSAC